MLNIYKWVGKILVVWVNTTWENREAMESLIMLLSGSWFVEISTGRKCLRIEPGGFLLGWGWNFKSHNVRSNSQISNISNSI
jgi:hypothetical protein